MNSISMTSDFSPLIQNFVDEPELEQKINRIWHAFYTLYCIPSLSCRDLIALQFFLKNCVFSIYGTKNFRFLHKKITSNLRELNEDAFLLSLEDHSEVYDPSFYVKLPERMNQVSLARAWVKIYPILEEEGIQSLPSQEANGSEVSDWLSKNASQLKEIEELDLSGLDLLVVPSELKYFSNLKRLNLSHNKIQWIAPGVWNNRALMKLNLLNNPLVCIFPDTFRGVFNLEIEVEETFFSTFFPEEDLLDVQAIEND